MPNREQVALQCEAVAHMARALASVYSDFAEITRAGVLDVLLNERGKSSARLMERLGDIVNNMDANDPADDWMKPVFAEAHRLYPPEPSDG